MSRHVLPVTFAIPFVVASGFSTWGGEPAVRDIVPAGAKLEQLWNDGEFTEGPAAGPDGAIYFSDITRDETPGRVLKFDPRTARTTVHCADSGKSNGLMFDRRGRLIAACGANHGRQALCEITPDGKVKALVGTFMGRKFNAPNDLTIHPDGSIYFSDPRYVGPEPMEIDHMSVYRYDPDGGRVTRVTTDIEKPNGLGLSPGGRTLYVAETNNGTTGIQPGQAAKPGRMTLNAFPLQPDGTLGRKRVLVDFGDQTGIDGMAVDTDGRIFAAVRSASRFGIVAFSPDGRELAYLATPELPTNCCFGRGEDAQTLYVTAGTGLYRIRLNATGFHPATAPAG
ncbi:MAG TPA: SMP-30/gluconolactonase/LRE family protein [Planctomycetaceae bacterium]|nr:SMP-30/gluconolactonase/LRE family protein [Planctomycetaceae bacterium]